MKAAARPATEGRAAAPGRGVTPLAEHARTGPEPPRGRRRAFRTRRPVRLGVGDRRAGREPPPARTGPGGDAGGGPAPDRPGTPRGRRRAFRTRRPARREAGGRRADRWPPPGRKTFLSPLFPRD